MDRFARGALMLLLLLAGRIAAAQPASAAYDPSQLPAVSGRVAQYSLTPRGDVDGLILDDGLEVHLPPRLGSRLVDAVKPGDPVTIHGLRARAVPMVQAVSISNDATKQRVLDDGSPPEPPPGPGSPRQPMTAQGRIKLQLHGPRGDLNGVLLEDGTIVRLPPPAAQRMAAQLQPGMLLNLLGEGTAGPFGRVVEATELPR